MRLMVCVFVSVLSQLLTACGQADVRVRMMEPEQATALYQVQASETPDAKNQLYYEHTPTGIFFLYPSDWQIDEARDRISLYRDDVQFIVEYVRRIPDEVEIKSDVQSSEQHMQVGTVHLFGQSQPVYLDESRQRLHYTSPIATDDSNSTTYIPFGVSNIYFSIYLETEQSSISEELRQVSDTVVESLSFTWLMTRPQPQQMLNWQLYQDDETTLQFYHHPDWTVERTSSAIHISDNQMRLTLLLDDHLSGLPAGDLQKGDPSHIWISEQAIARVNLMLDDKIKAIYYGQPGMVFAVGDYQIIALLEDVSRTTYDSINLPTETLFDWLLTTLEA